MLEHVTANQTRFVTPGLSADPRGVALGRHCLVLLPSVDRVVGLLRGLSREVTIDDLRVGLCIEQVVTPLKSREMVVLLPVRSSHAADQIAAVAGLNGGLTFTGTARHFVQFRDSRSPLGYDATSLEAGGDGDYMLYARDFTQSYTRTRELSLERLVMGMALEEVIADRLVPGEDAVLRVEHGLWRPVMGYLHRNRRPCAVASCDAHVPGGGGDAQRLHLMRTALEPRMEALFRDTPGVGVFRLITDNTAVEVGFRHPVELTSVSDVFPEQCFHLFSGEPSRLEVIAGEPVFVQAADLVRLGAGADQEVEVLTHHAAAVERVAVPLRLVPSPGVRRAVTASRIPMRQVEQLKKLVYLLPPRVLERTRLALAGDEIFLLGEEGLEFFPLGELHYELAPGVLAPLGFELIPRVHPDVLLDHLQRQGDVELGGEVLHFFSPDNPVALRLPRGAFAPLSRRALADVPLHGPTTGQVTLPAEATRPQLLNDPPGLFPLWGYKLEGPGEDEGPAES